MFIVFVTKNDPAEILFRMLEWVETNNKQKINYSTLNHEVKST